MSLSLMIVFKFPPVDELLNKSSGVTHFFELDLNSKYHQIGVTTIALVLIIILCDFGQLLILEIDSSGYTYFFKRSSYRMQ